MNLLVGDLRSHSVAYLTNRGRTDSLKAPQALEPGVYGISNGVLGDPWVKVRRRVHPPCPTRVAAVAQVSYCATACRAV